MYTPTEYADAVSIDKFSMSSVDLSNKIGIVSCKKVRNSLVSFFFKKRKIRSGLTNAMIHGIQHTYIIGKLKTYIDNQLNHRKGNVAYVTYHRSKKAIVYFCDFRCVYIEAIPSTFELSYSNAAYSKLVCDEVVISRHALTRSKQRLGWSFKTLKRMLPRIIEKGIKFIETKGHLRRYLEQLLGNFDNNKSLFRLYAQHIFIFKESTLITVHKLQHKEIKYLKYYKQ